MIRWLMVSAVGCGIANEPEPSATSHVVTFEHPIESVKPIDVLFVLDESPAMGDAHARMVASMPAFASAFEAKLAGQDLNIGVITTSDGRLVDGDFLHERSTMTAIERDFTGDLAARLVERADRMTTTPGANQVLASIELAISPTTNPGFHRDNAPLFLVVITNRDDESPGDVDAYAHAFGVPHRYFLSLVAPYLPPRLQRFLPASFPEDGGYASWLDIASDDFAGATPLFDDALITRWRGNRCLDAFIAEPHDCAVSDVTNGFESARLAACESGVVPCWRFESAPQECAGDQTSIIVAEHAAFPPPNTWIRGQCTAEIPSN